MLFEDIINNIFQYYFNSHEIKKKFNNLYKLKA